MRLPTFRAVRHWTWSPAPLTFVLHGHRSCLLVLPYPLAGSSLLPSSQPSAAQPFPSCMRSAEDDALAWVDPAHRPSTATVRGDHLLSQETTYSPRRSGWKPRRSKARVQRVRGAFESRSKMVHCPLGVWGHTHTTHRHTARMCSCGAGGPCRGVRPTQGLPQYTPVGEHGASPCRAFVRPRVGRRPTLLVASPLSSCFTSGSLSKCSRATVQIWGPGPLLRVAVP